MLFTNTVLLLALSSLAACLPKVARSPCKTPPNFIISNLHTFTASSNNASSQLSFTYNDPTFSLTTTCSHIMSPGANVSPVPVSNVKCANTNVVFSYDGTTMNIAETFWCNGNAFKATMKGSLKISTNACQNTTSTSQYGQGKDCVTSTTGNFTTVVA